MMFIVVLIIMFLYLLNTAKYARYSWTAKELVATASYVARSPLKRKGEV